MPKKSSKRAVINFIFKSFSIIFLIGIISLIFDDPTSQNVQTKQSNKNEHDETIAKIKDYQLREQIKNQEASKKSIEIPKPVYYQTYLPSASYESGSGHEMEHNWAEEKDIDNIDDCGGNSNSFIEGCESYVEENYPENDCDNYNSETEECED